MLHENDERYGDEGRQEVQEMGRASKSQWAG